MQPSRPSQAALGRVVRELRNERGLTIEGLADAAEMHATYLSGIERGRNNPSWNRLADLAAALDVPMSHIVLRVEALDDQL